MGIRPASHSLLWIVAVRIASVIGLLCIAHEAPAQGLRSATRSNLAPDHGALGSAAIRRYLATAHGVGPTLRKECGGSTPLKDLHITYARLLGTREVQALVEATTCMMGNGGADIVLVLRRGARHRIEPLTLDDSSRPVEELYAGQTRTPRIEARSGKVVRWFVKDVSPSKNSQVRREITYRWSGDRFVIYTVRDLPEIGR
jgi:hypothetical protein